MFVRVAGLVAALVIALPVGQAAAQYANPPHSRVVAPADDDSGYYFDDDDDAPVARPHRYSRDRYEEYARRPYGHRYVRVLPDDDDGYDAPTPSRRPYFVEPDSRRATSGSVQGDPRGVDRPSIVVTPREEAAPRPPAAVEAKPADVASLPADDQPDAAAAKQPAPQFRRQTVDYPTKQPPGTIVIDTRNTYLYLVLGHGQAMRYGIGVGREGFTWSGTEHITRMAEWPDWTPPDQMIDRQPYLPRFMAGGPGNPLGARALYLGNTLYRIHGTNDPSTIGQYVSSGCIRLTDTDVEDLYSRVHIGTRVVVLPGKPPTTASVSHAATH